MSRPKAPLLDCPECDTSALKADHWDSELGWRWTDGVKAKCPKCEVALIVSVTDDYEEDCLATLKVDEDEVEDADDA